MVVFIFLDLLSFPRNFQNSVMAVCDHESSLKRFFVLKKIGLTAEGKGLTFSEAQSTVILLYV